MKNIFKLFILLFLGKSFAQTTLYKTLTDHSYYENLVNDAYQNKPSKLDLCYPEGVKKYSTVVWFNGGGFKSVSKAIPKQIKEKGLAIVAVNYRLHPKVNAPKYIEDAAAAVAWGFKNIERYGGYKKQIYICGFSSGGYLSLMAALDQEWLKEHNLESNSIKEVVTLSATTFTNHTIRKKYVMEITQALIDHYASVYYARGDAPPITLVTGDREKEFFGMYEENAYVMRMLKLNGHEQIELIEIGGYGHLIT